MVQFAAVYPGRLIAVFMLIAARAFADSASLPDERVVGDHASTGWQGISDSLVVPVRRSGNLMLVEARLADQAGYFVLDTGAPGLVLNRAYFRSGFRLETAAAGITGEAGEVYATTVPRLELRSAWYEDVPAEMINLGHLEDRHGVRLFGLLGAGLFRQVELAIDLRNSRIVLHRLDGEGRAPARSLAPSPDVSAKLSIQQDILFTRCMIRKRELLMCVDTGAELSALHHAVHRDVLDTFIPQKRSRVGGAGPGQAEVLAGVIREIEVGGHRFAFQQALIANLEHLQQVYRVPIDGILGFGLLEEGEVVINQQTGFLSVYLYHT